MKKIILFIIIIFFTACSNLEKQKEYKKEFYEGIKENNIKVFQQKSGDLAFKVLDDGKEYKFLAKLEENSENESYGVSYIESNKKLNIDGNSLEVLSSKKWDEIQLKLFQDIVPKEPNKGILFLIYYYEIVAYRNEKNEIIFSSFENIPKEIKIVEKYDNEKFIKYTTKILDTLTEDTQENIIFNTSDIEKNQMPFVYYNKKNKTLISLYNSYKDSQNHNSISYLLLKNTVGLINNPVTVLGRLIFYIYNSAYVLTTQGISIPKNIPEISNKNEDMNLENFLSKISKISHKKSYKGSVEFLIDGENFFFDFLKSIQEAKKDILIRTYIFDNDDYSVKIADILKKKSKEDNINIKILMDEIGSMTAAMTNPNSPMPLDFVPPRRIDNYIEKNSNINCRTTKNPWFTTDHNKVMIFDDNLAYMGGMNIGKEYRYEWHDMMTKVQGPIVGVLEEDFKEAWAHAGLGGDFSYFKQMIFRNENYNLENKNNYIDILPIYTKTGRTEILNVTLEAIKSSKKQILIENAYFSDDNIIKELIKARQRGVEVAVILPYWGNHNVMNSSNMVTTNILIKSGVKVYLYPKMNHVKASIFDNFAMVGTANYDKFSMRVNQEINFCFWDKPTVKILKNSLFEKDLKESTEVTGEFPILWVDYLLEKVANQL